MAHVLDPPTTSFPTTPIFSTRFTVTFTDCSPGELPGGMTANGCFAGVNRTGLDWTNLQFIFPDAPALANQTAGCALAPSNNIFSTPTCGGGGGDPFTLDFTGGVLRDGQLFFVTEDGVSPASNFPPGQATVLSTTTVTPEPTTFVLLGTGLGVLAVFGRRMQSA